jgi:hypothetical protein
LTPPPSKVGLINPVPKSIKQDIQSAISRAFRNDFPAIPISPYPKSPEITLDAIQIIEESISYHQSISSSPWLDIHILEPTSKDEPCYQNRDRKPPKRYGFLHGSAHLVYKPNPYQEAMNFPDINKWIAAM